MELLIVLAVMALAVALAPALLGPARARVAVRTSAQEVAADLRALRGLAVSRNQETRATIDIVDHSFTLDPQGEIRRLPLDIALAFTGPRSLMDGVKGRILFYPDGSSTGGQIEFSAAGEFHHVEVHWLSGLVSLDD